MSTDDAVWNEIADVPESDTPPADAETAEPDVPDLMSVLEGVFKALPADYEREKRELPQKLLAERNALIADVANLTSSAARLRQEHNEARANLAEAVRVERRWASQTSDALVAAWTKDSERLSAERDAERERYTRLVGEVERICTLAQASQESAAELTADLDHVVALDNLVGSMLVALSDVVAATAPQTAPAQPAAKRRCLHGHSCCGFEWTTHWPDEDAHHCGLPAGEHDLHRCDCGATSEPTAADPEPVRVTAPSEAQEGAQGGFDLIADTAARVAGMPSVGQQRDAWAGTAVELAAEVGRRASEIDLLRSLIKVDRSAHPVGDEHLQAGDWVAAELYWSEVEQLRTDLAEARREAKRLRGEMAQLADKADRYADSALKHSVHQRSNPAGVTEEGELLAQVSDAAAVMLRDMAKRLRAVDAGSSDTTTGGGEG